MRDSWVPPAMPLIPYWWLAWGRRACSFASMGAFAVTSINFGNKLFYNGYALFDVCTSGDSYSRLYGDVQIGLINSMLDIVPAWGMSLGFI